MAYSRPMRMVRAAFRLASAIGVAWAAAWGGPAAAGINPSTEPPPWFSTERPPPRDGSAYALPGAGASQPGRWPGAADAVPQNPRLGWNFSNYYDMYPLARDAGASHDRVTFSMAATQPGQGAFNWSAYDQVVNGMAAPRNVEVLGVLVEPPQWAAADPGERPPVWWVPRGLDQPWSSADNVWAQWVYRVVQRYKARVRAWEVWNEPNLDFWSGTPAQFARLLKVSYQAIKAADPTATVVFGGVYKGVNIHVTLGAWQALADDPEGAANGYFFDVMGFHLYDGGTCDTFDLIGYMKSLMPPALQGKPWWITESGIRVRDGDWPEYANPTEQASYVLQNYAYALYKDIKRYYFWRANDADDLVQPWGLVTNQGQRRPAYAAFQVAASRLPATFNWSVRSWGNNGAVSRISFYGTPLGRVTVLWNVSNAPQFFSTFAIFPNATLVQQDGSAARITTSTGQRAFQLAPAQSFRWPYPMCQVASRPQIIIERDVTPPVATPSPLPPASDPLIRLTWRGEDPYGAGDDGAGGVWSYQVQVRENGGPWRWWSDWEEATATTFTGTLGSTYAFRVRALDWAGNYQSWSSAAVVTTTVGAITRDRRVMLPLLRRP